MKVEREKILKTLEVLADSFQKFLYEDDEKFLENMKTKSLAGDDISRYQHWEWTQGVGLYGLYQLAKELDRNDYTDFLKSFYEILRRHVYPQIYDIQARGLHHYGHKVLPYIMKIACHGTYDDLAGIGIGYSRKTGP